MKGFIFGLFMLTTALAGIGCSSGGSASVDSWQRDLVKFVELKKNDPNALRDTTINSNRPGFGIIGGENPAKSRDAWGVLLGHPVIEGRPWFVYLVGIVDEQKVEDIRLAAVSFAGGKPTWRITKENQRALHQYQVHGRDVWHKAHPNTKNVPPEFTTFPRDADRFDLALQDKQIDVTHTDSAAHWRLTLP